MLRLNTLMLVITSFIMNTQSDKGIFDGDDIFNEIVGGRETEPSNYPYIVTIQVNGYHYCGGSILRTEYPAMVLTAAHCYKNPNYNHVVVRLYAKDADASYNHNTNNYIDTSIWDTAIHPGYNPNTLDNDIMVIWLNEGIEQYPQLRPVRIEPNAIPSGGNLECCHHDEPLQVIGYGNDCFSCQNTPTLEYVDLGYMDRSMCKPEFYGRSHQVTDNMLCAAELPNGGSDACQGDSGGPLIIAGTNKQIGIVSWGIGCATHYPGVYTDIGIFYDWIQQKMYQQMDDGQRKEMELMMDQNRKMDSVFIVKSQYYYYFGMSVSGVLLVTAILYCCKNREYEAILEKEENVFMPIC